MQEKGSKDDLTTHKTHYVDDSLSWNYIHAVQDKKVDSIDDNVQNFITTDVENHEEKNALLWCIGYMLFFLFLARKNMKNFFEFGMRQEVLADLVSKYNFELNKNN